MLLQEVYQLPEKQYTPDINPVLATLTVVGEYTQQTDPFPQYVQQVQLKDESGVSAEVKIQTKYEKGLMAPNMVGRKARWRLKWYQGGQKQVIVGYCLDKMGAPQQTPSAAPQAAQAPSPAPQSSNVPQPRDYDAENRGKIRHGLVCAYISAGVDPDIQTVNYWMEYIMTGNAPVPPGQNPAALEDETPPWES